MVRLRVDPALTRVEAKQLETRAAEDLRGVGNYVARLVAQDLAKEPKARRRTGARVTDRREPFDMAIPLSTTDRKRLKERADAEMRSISNYVATLILEDLKRRR